MYNKSWSQRKNISLMQLF